MQNELSKQEIKKIINALLKFIEIPVNEKDYLIIENILKDINTTISDK